MTVSKDELIERLRAFEGSDALGNGDFGVALEAADRIASLETELAQLRSGETRPKYWERPQGDAGDAVDFACDHAKEPVFFLEDWRSGRADEWPEYIKWLSVQHDGAKASAAFRETQEPTEAMNAMLVRDNKRMREAGCKLAEAAIYTVREYDGLHRLSMAVSDWSKAVADEGDRAMLSAAPREAVEKDEV